MCKSPKVINPAENCAFLCDHLFEQRPNIAQGMIIRSKFFHTVFVVYGGQREICMKTFECSSVWFCFISKTNPLSPTGGQTRDPINFKIHTFELNAVIFRERPSKQKVFLVYLKFTDF